MTATPFKRVGILAALPGELAPLVKSSPTHSWARVETGKGIHQWERDAIQKDGQPAKWIAVCAGIGRDAVTRAFAAAEREAPLTAVVSAGWAGALTPSVQPGSVLAPAWIVNAQTGEQFDLTLSENSRGGMVTTARVADAAEKARLAAAYPGAMLVDMEAATVARLASMRGIPAYCFKGVSDGLGDRLPDMNPFIDAMGQFHTARFVASVALRPQYWGALGRFGANSKKAASELASTVRSFLEDGI